MSSLMHSLHSDFLELINRVALVFTLLVLDEHEIAHSPDYPELAEC